MKGLFLSIYDNKVDNKGRVSIPAQFRDVIVSEDNNNVIVYKSLTKDCLEGCTSSHITNLSNAISNFDPFSQEKDSFATAIFAESIALEFDKDGRINIPKQYTSYADISTNALFVGKGHTFEIWNPEKFKLYSEECRKFAVQNAKMLKWN